MKPQGEINPHCPECGATLISRWTFEQTSLELPVRLYIMYTCPDEPGNSYLEIIDPVLELPLFPLRRDTVDNLFAASEEKVTEAVRHIRVIDYKTVSIAEFEKVLAGVSRDKPGRRRFSAFAPPKSEPYRDSCS